MNNIKNFLFRRMIAKFIDLTAAKLLTLGLFSIIWTTEFKNIRLIYDKFIANNNILPKEFSVFGAGQLKIAILMTIIYFIILWLFNVLGFRGQSLGKWILKIKIVNSKGNNISPKLMIIHELCATGIMFFTIILAFVVLSNNWNLTFYFIFIFAQYAYIFILGFLAFRRDSKNLNSFWYDQYLKTIVIKS